MCVILNPFIQGVTSDNLEVSDLAGGLAGSEVTMAGWGKTRDKNQSRANQIVSSKK